MATKYSKLTTFHSPFFNKWLSLQFGASKTHHVCCSVTGNWEWDNSLNPQNASHCICL